jgi:bis(5'-nucleosyl)-tetraphosphatase (symmetrical)
MNNAWAIGDIQGCFDEFVELVELIDAHTAEQGIIEIPKLWLVGDLVNRGPKSLETLEWLIKHQDRCRIVLGNHDLNFLAVAAGVRKTKADDTLDALMQSPDRKRLVSWVRHQQLAHFEDGILMVHAGVLPQWDVAMTLAYAAEIEFRLQSADWKDFISQMYGNEPAQWRGDLKGADRRRVSVNALTRLRFCSASGVMEFNTKESAGHAPSGFLPWFALPERRTREQTLVFGHWSTLGLMNSPKVIALDTGCVWGGALSAVNLQSRKLLQVPSRRGRKQS